MSRSERMQPVAQVVQTRERDAARAVGLSQRLLDEQRERLRQLEQYRGEYLQNFQRQGSSGISGGQLRQWQQFIATLDQAIGLQRQQVVAAERDLQQKQRLWQQALTKQKAVDNVITRFRQEEERVRSKREQKEIDELALRRHNKPDP